MNVVFYDSSLGVGWQGEFEEWWEIETETVSYPGMSDSLWPHEL